MEQDIVPDLLDAITKDFDAKTLASPKIKQALKLLKAKKATYLTVNDFAVEVGEILAKVFGEKITAEILPDGKMYFNIADRLLNTTLSNNFDLISGFAGDVQKELNEAAEIGLKVQIPELNQDKIDGIVNRVSSEDNFQDISWILKAPIINFCLSIVDDAIKKNFEFQSSAGLNPTIVRIAHGNDCEWCRKLAGSFKRSDVPKDIYRRHQRCRCTVDFNPSTGKQKNINSKKLSEKDNDAKIEERKKFRLNNSYDTSKYPHDSNGNLRPTRTVKNRVPDDCQPYEIIDVVTSKGSVNRTLINEFGGRGMRIDSSDHGQPKYHPMGAHKHIMVYDEHGKFQSDGKPSLLNPQDRKENNDIL